MITYENIITEPSNFLEALCLAAKDQSMSLNAQEVFANVLTMLLAGEDTTANVAAWATHLLALHPEVQNKIYEEVARELSGALPQNWQDLEKLKYTEGVALEALRMKSAAPVLFLQPTKDVVINDILVTKEVMIITTTREVGMQSQHFSEPEKFIPERWLVDPTFRIVAKFFVSIIVLFIF